MIIRKRKKPLPLQKLGNLISRLHPNHPKLEAIKKDAAKRYKGYIGEQKVDYFLERLSIDCIIAHDICLESERRFQIDSIVLTKRAIYIIETKNYTGTITFDTTLQQLIREHAEQEEGFDYPITQAENTKHQLEKWLLNRNISNVPIHYFIVVSDPSTIIRVHGNEQFISKYVTHAANLNMLITKKERTIKNSHFNHRNVGQMILQACQEFDFDILSQHGITSHDILHGVICPKCKSYSMKRRHSKWQCPTCHHLSKHAHIPAINDYLLLIKPHLSNKNCRKFLRIHSRSVATRLLKATKLTYNSRIKAWHKK